MRLARGVRRPCRTISRLPKLIYSLLLLPRIMDLVAFAPAPSSVGSDHSATATTLFGIAYYLVSPAIRIQAYTTIRMLVVSHQEQDTMKTSELRNLTATEMETIQSGLSGGGARRARVSSRRPRTGDADLTIAGYRHC